MELLQLDLATPGVEVRARTVARRIGEIGGLSEVECARMAALASELARAGRHASVPSLRVEITGDELRWALPGGVAPSRGWPLQGWEVDASEHALVVRRRLATALPDHAVGELQRELLVADPAALAVEVQRQNQELVDALARLREAEREVVRSERRLSLAVDATGLGTWERGPEGWWLSPRCAVILEVEPGTALPDALEPSLAELLATGLTRLSRAAGSLVIDGVALHGAVVEIRATSDGDLVVGTLRDITEQRDRERRLESQAELRQVLMGMAGHDLRNPLAVVQQGLQLVERGVDPGPLVERMRRACDAATDMVRAMLDVTEAELAEGIQIEPRPADLHELAHEAVQAISLVHPAVSVTHERRGDGTGRFDPGRLGQVLSNLLDNAVRHTTGGVRVGTEGTTEGLVLTVSNPGPVIPHEDQAHLFDPLYRARGARGRGIGLGLFIVRHIAERHEGTVTVTSDEAGTTFRVWIPRP